MTELLDELTGPGRELEALTRDAQRNARPLPADLLVRIRQFLDNEERWLLPQLQRAGIIAETSLDRHRDAHDRLRAIVEQLAHMPPGVPQARAVEGALASLLSRHLREERRLLRSVLHARPLEPTPELRRFIARSGAQDTEARNVAMG